MKKRILSFVLAICLIFPCIFLLSACDEGKITYINVVNISELKTALTNDIDNDVIVLKANIDLKDVNDNQALMINSGKHVLDLNGYKLTGVDNGVNSWHAIDLRGASTELTIKDSSTVQTGTIEGRCYGIQVSRGAKLVIDGGNFTCTTNGTFNQNVVVYGGSLVVNGGTFTSKVGEVIYGSTYTWNLIEYQNSITINEGSFNNIGLEGPNKSLFIFENDNQTVVFNGGTFNQNNLEFIIGYNNTINFTNNAEIPEEEINIF